MSRDMHWILTLTHQRRDGVTVTNTTDGVMAADSDASRQVLYREALRYVCDMKGIATYEAMVNFFSLEPNDIAGGTP